MTETLVSFEQIEQEMVEKKTRKYYRKNQLNEKLAIEAAQTIFKIQ